MQLLVKHQRQAGYRQLHLRVDYIIFTCLICCQTTTILKTDLAHVNISYTAPQSNITAEQQGINKALIVAVQH